MKTTKKFELFGNKFKVVVQEKKNEREVTVMDWTQYTQHGHSYVLVRETKNASSGGWFSEKKELPRRDRHVARCVNNAIEKWLNSEKNESSFETDVNVAADRVINSWEKQIDTTDNYK